MFSIVISLFISVFLVLTRSYKDLVSTIIAQQRQIEILNRTLEFKGCKPHFTNNDRLFLSVFSKISDKVKNLIQIVQPETLLKWFRQLVKNRWNYSHKRKPGRKPISTEIKNLILRIKNENIFVGAGKIQGELMKLGHKVSLSTIRRVQ